MPEGIPNLNLDKPEKISDEEQIRRWEAEVEAITMEIIRPRENAMGQQELDSLTTKQDSLLQEIKKLKGEKPEADIPGRGTTTLK
jgi:hypothetical protein